MEKSDLRTVEYKTKMGEKLQAQKGYFHLWFKSMDYLDGFQVSNLYAIIETECGNIVYADPKYIKFI